MRSEPRPQHFAFHVAVASFPKHGHFYALSTCQSFPCLHDWIEHCVLRQHKYGRRYSFEQHLHLFVTVLLCSALLSVVDNSRKSLI